MQPTKRFYRPDEVAGILNVSVKTVARRIAEGELEAVRVSPRKVRISADALERFLAEAKKRLLDLDED